MVLKHLIQPASLILGGSVLGVALSPVIGATFLGFLPSMIASFGMGVGANMVLSLAYDRKDYLFGPIGFVVSIATFIYAPAAFTVSMGMTFVGLAGGAVAAYRLRDVDIGKTITDFAVQLGADAKKFRHSMSGKLDRLHWKLAAAFPFLQPHETLPPRADYMVPDRFKAKPRDPLFEGHGPQSVDVQANWNQALNPHWQVLDADKKISILPPKHVSEHKRTAKAHIYTPQ